MHDTELDERLDRSRLDVGDCADLSAELAREIAAQPRRRRRPSRRVAIGLAAVVVAVPGAAAAVGYSVYTGLRGDPVHNTEDVDRSPILRLCVPGYSAVIERDRPSAASPLPAGLTWPMAEAEVRVITARICAQGPTVMQETGLRRQYNDWALCAWMRAGVAPGADRTSAAREIRHYATSEVNRVTTAQDGTIVPHELRLADQVRRGDLAGTRHEIALNCGDLGLPR